MTKKDLIKKLYVKNKLNFSFLLFSSLAETTSLMIISIMLEKLISIAYEKNLQELINQGIIFLILLLVMIVLYLILTYIKPTYRKKALSQYKQNIYNLILEKNISSFSNYETSIYISAITNDVNYIEENYIFSIFDLIRNITLFIASVVIMILYSPLLTLVAIGLSLLPLVCSLLVGNKLSKCEEDISNNNASFMHYIKDNLIGFSTIKVFKAEEKMKLLFSKNNDRLELSKAKKAKVFVIIEFIQTITSIIAQIGVFFVGAYIAIKKNSIEPATIVLFVQLMNHILGPLMEIPPIISKRKASLPLFEKISKMIKIDEEAKEEVREFNNNILLNNVSLTISDNNIINGIDLKIEKNKSYAIVGPSGSGKTTLLNLLVGKFNNYNGSITYDNKQLKNISQDSLYEFVSFIEQNVFVFDDTIENNITMYSQVNEELLKDVIDKSGLSKFIFEKGLDYKCGENGCNLSGGEKQRIAIARGLLKNSQIMLLDEMTSALDNETSNTVTLNVLNLIDITKIMITHKLDEKVLSKFDQIIVIKDGKINEQGTYDELINNQGLFKTLIELN